MTAAESGDAFLLAGSMCAGNFPVSGKYRGRSSTNWFRCPNGLGGTSIAPGACEAALNRDVQSPLSALDVIFSRRSVRQYTAQRVDDTTVRGLLDAAVQAPTALHEEPWALVVIQDAALLKRDWTEMHGDTAGATSDGRGRGTCTLTLEPSCISA